MGLSYQGLNNDYPFEIHLSHPLWQLFMMDQYFTPIVKIRLRSNGKPFRMGSVQCYIVSHDNPSTFTNVSTGTHIKSYSLNYMYEGDTKTFYCKIPGNFLKPGYFMFRCEICVGRMQGSLRDELLLQLRDLPAVEQQQIVGQAEQFFNSQDVPRDFSIGFDEVTGSYALEPVVRVWDDRVLKIHSAMTAIPTLLGIFGAIFAAIAFVAKAI